jgi:ectoine hydroxylase-related dioxygenase (phytanoyl-CoA dioxygenase family)
MSEQYLKDGYLFLENIFDPEDLEDFENTLIRMGRALLKQVGHSPVPDDTYELLRTLERNYKDEFFTLCSQSGGSSSGWALGTAKRLRAKLKEAAGNDAPSYFVQAMGVFYNEPDVTRLHTVPHQEASYFPGIRTGHHCWFPLFRDLKKEDGPLIVYRGSHVEHFPYSKIAKPRSITQLVTPPEIVAKYEPVLCNLKRGDGVLFHHNCVHATAPNSSGLPRVSAVVRFVDLIAETPFKPWLKFAYHEEEVKKEIDQRSDT